MTTGPGHGGPTPPGHRARRRAATALAAACAVFGAGCGLLPGTGDGRERSPVTVMTWAPQRTQGTNQPGMTAMARAYERWVNADGGIDGRKLRVLTCDEGDDPVTASACARRAVREGAVAVVGSYSEQDVAVFSPLSIAGIPYIGGYGATPEEFVNPVSYPVNGGLPALLAGQGEQLAGACAKVSLVRPDAPRADDWARLLTAGLTRSPGASGAPDSPRSPGARAVDLPVPGELSDYTPQADAARSALGGQAPGRGCVSAVLGDRTATFFDSFRRLDPGGPGVRISSVLGSVDQALLDRSGGASGPYEGAAVTGWYPAPQDPRWAPMREVVKEHAFGDNRVDPTDAGVQTTWIAYTVLRRAVESLRGGPVTAAKVRESLDKGLKISTGGLTPTLNWGQDYARTVIGFPRMTNPRVTRLTVTGGRLTPPADGPATTDTTATLERADITTL